MTVNLGEVAQCVTAFTALAAFVSSRLNARKLKLVAVQTDGLAHLLAVSSKAEGTAEGKAIGLAEGRAEGK
jgi:hypothetical protein